MTDYLAQLAEVVVKGKIKEAKPLTEQALAAGVPANEIIFNGLSKGMEVVGQKYEKKEYYLPPSFIVNLLIRILMYRPNNSLLKTI